jgi:hypothetical protein
MDTSGCLEGRQQGRILAHRRATGLMTIFGDCRNSFAFFQCNPAGSSAMKRAGAQNRATAHVYGGASPADGRPRQMPRSGMPNHSIPADRNLCESVKTCGKYLLRSPDTSRGFARRADSALRSAMQRFMLYAERTHLPFRHTHGVQASACLDGPMCKTKPPRLDLAPRTQKCKTKPT